MDLRRVTVSFPGESGAVKYPFLHYYGLGEWKENHSLSETAQQFGISTENARKAVYRSAFKM